MSSKRKGIQGERELIHLFYQNNWSAVRVAGSGSSKYASPDILAGNGYRRIALECKTTKEKNKYLTKEEIKELKEFSGNFGVEAWVAVRFKKWFFLLLEDLIETNKSFLVNQELVEKKGLSFNQLIGKEEKV